MKSLADLLPPDIAAKINPLWRTNEAGYWQARDQLLKQYEGQWIGFADGAVVAAGKLPVEVFHAAEATGKHPFCTCVGYEDEPERIRRTSFPYDTSYRGEPMPVLRVEFRAFSGNSGVIMDKVIPDIGADAGALPWADCQRLSLDLSQARPGQIGSIAGFAKATVHFKLWVEIDGQEYPCRIHVDFVGHERILGRDVLNRLEILFRGPANEVVVNP
jgi:hypothetical protein